jgi:TRAP-type mannitol/chloroaromatic compound transport system substrate-binding protein
LKEWEALDDDLKMIVKQAAANTNLMVLSRFQAANNTALQTLINEHDVNLAPYSDELIKAIGERATTVIPELAQKSADATELYNNLVTFRKTMVQWSGYSEGNFMNKRIAASFQTI